VIIGSIPVVRVYNWQYIKIKVVYREKFDLFVRVPPPALSAERSGVEEPRVEGFESGSESSASGTTVVHDLLH
jgi:hypothetical protein